MKTRSQTLLDITAEAVRARQMQVLSFANEVAERYLATVPPDARVVKFRELGTDMDQALSAQRHNGQIVDRYLKGVVKAFPADLEDVWVQCLPEAYRAKAYRELAARHGMLPARMPDATARDQITSFSSLVRSFGASVESAAPIYADGKVDAADEPYLDKAIRDLDDHVATCISSRTQMVQVRDNLRADGKKTGGE